MSEISLVKYNVTAFFSIVLNSFPLTPIYTKQLKIVDALLKSEPEPDKEMVERLKWLYENTHEKVKISLPVIEYIVFHNINKGVNREVELMNKTFHLTMLYKYLDETSFELSQMVITIAKKYSLDVAFNFTNQNKGGGIQLT
jgi:hypothetical protein